MGVLEVSRGSGMGKGRGGGGVGHFCVSSVLRFWTDDGAVSSGMYGHIITLCIFYRNTPRRTDGDHTTEQWPTQAFLYTVILAETYHIKFAMLR